MYRMLVLLVAGCVDIPTEMSFDGELVITELDGLSGVIDLDVTDSTIRWTTNSIDGSQIHTAALADRPLIARQISPHGTTTANLLVDGDTVYVTDYFGVMAMTEDGTTQVVKDDFVSTLALDNNHDLIWEHVGVVSWFEDGVADVGIASVSHVEHLVASGDRIYASTRTVRTNGLVFGSLYRIDKPTRTAKLMAHAPSFASEFNGVSDQQLGCGLYAIEDTVYWCVEGDQGLEGGPRKLLAEVRPRGLEIVLPPQPTSRILEHEGTFYWTASQEGSPVWGLTPGEEPRELLPEGGIGGLKTIADGYLYGVRVSPYPGELQVRRVPIP